MHSIHKARVSLRSLVVTVVVGTPRAAFARRHRIHRVERRKPDIATEPAARTPDSSSLASRMRRTSAVVGVDVSDPTEVSAATV